MKFNLNSYSKYLLLFYTFTSLTQTYAQPSTSQTQFILTFPQDIGSPAKEQELLQLTSKDVCRIPLPQESLELAVASLKPTTDALDDLASKNGCGKNDSSSGKNDHLYEQIDELLDQYKSLPVKALSENASDFDESAQIILNKKIAKKERLEHPTFHKAYHLFARSTELVVLEGAGGIAGKGVGKLVVLGANQGQRLLNKSPMNKSSNSKTITSIPLKDFLPPDSDAIASVRRTTGGLLMATGAASVIMAPFSLGAAGAATAAIGASVSTAGTLAERRFTESENRSKSIQLAKQSAKAGIVEVAEASKNIVEAAADEIFEAEVSALLTDGGLPTISDIIGMTPYDPTDLITDQIGGTAVSNSVEGAVNGATNVLPVLGGVRQMAQGGKLIWESYKGTEKHHEFLLKQEDIFQKIVNQDLQKKKLVTLEMLSELHRSGKNSPDIGLYHEKLNGLCEALQWQENFQTKADKAFEKRKKYLEKRIQRKNARKELKYSVIGNPHEKQLKKLIMHMYNTSEQLQKENYTLKDQLRLPIKDFVNAQFSKIQLYPNKNSIGKISLQPFQSTASVDELSQLAESEYERLSHLYQLNQILKDQLKNSNPDPQAHFPKPTPVQLKKIETPSGDQILYRTVRKDVKKMKEQLL